MGGGRFAAPRFRRVAGMEHVCGAGGRARGHRSHRSDALPLGASALHGRHGRRRRVLLALAAAKTRFP